MRVQLSAVCYDLPVSDLSPLPPRKASIGRYLLCQLGSPKSRNLTISSLLGPADLPESGWRIFSEKSWRTGRMGEASERRLRARRAGTFSALRSLEHPATMKLILVRAVPMASEADAILEASEGWTGLVKRPHASGAVYMSVPVMSPEFDGLPAAQLSEQDIEGSYGPARMRSIRGSIGAVAFSVGCGARGDGWTWDDVFAITRIQIAKLHKSGL